jgi:hypothetical protein
MESAYLNAPARGRITLKSAVEQNQMQFVLKIRGLPGKPTSPAR